MAEKKPRKSAPPKKLRADRRDGSTEFPFTQEMADRICDAIATSSMSIKKICAANPDFPGDALIYKWIIRYPSFARQYELSRELQQIVMVESQDQIFDKAEKHTYRDREGNDRIDPGAIALAKLRSDNIKWVASRLSRKFRDKLEVNNLDGKKRTAEEVRKEIEKIKKNERPF